MRSGNTSFLGLGDEDLARVREDFDFYQIAFPAVERVQWDVSFGRDNLSYTEDASGQLVTKTSDVVDWNANCVSKHPVTRFRVQILDYAICDDGENIMIGFIDRNSIVEYEDNAEHKNAYCIYGDDGCLFGNGMQGDEYYKAKIKVGQVVEGVHNRADKTISFLVDGVDRGVAFADVQHEQLHVMCCLCTPNSKVKLLPTQSSH
jgi:hypothetical protein